ncbi:ATP-binding cassette domain-containing protein, partial [Bacillus haikouensis]|uniref:ATP-binding cassette domain-containing protein n=1 Tax=Bacillus haikouensis TaxID=1510468 RepID=UPI0015551779
MPNEVMVDVKGLLKRYGSFTAVNGVSFQVEKGEIFGLLGPNGAGKTTTIEMLVGLRKPDEGTA